MTIKVSSTTTSRRHPHKRRQICKFSARVGGEKGRERRRKIPWELFFKGSVPLEKNIDKFVRIFRPQGSVRCTRYSGGLPRFHGNDYPQRWLSRGLLKANDVNVVNISRFYRSSVCFLRNLRCSSREVHRLFHLAMGKQFSIMSDRFDAPRNRECNLRDRLRRDTFLLPILCAETTMLFKFALNQWLFLSGRNFEALLIFIYSQVELKSEFQLERVL